MGEGDIDLQKVPGKRVSPTIRFGYTNFPKIAGEEITCWPHSPGWI